MPKKISQLTAFGTITPANDLLVGVDVSDATQGAGGSTKKLTIAQLQTAVASGMDVSGGALTTSSSQIGILNAVILFRAIGTIQWSNGSQYTGTKDLILARDAAGQLALRNGTNAQSFAIYNTYTDESNYERLRITYSSNVANLNVERAGTGASRYLTILINGEAYATFGNGGVITSRTTAPFVSASYDLGSSSLIWRDLHLGRNAYFSETTDPTGVADKAILYAKDNGSGKTQLMVQFGTGTPIQIAIEA